MAKNAVFVNSDGIVEITVVGNQTVSSVKEMGEVAGTLLQGQIVKKEPALLLDDILQMGEVDSNARKAVIELGKTLPFDRCAMLGNGGVLRLGANLMLRAIGRGDTIRYFGSRTEALKWLKEKRRD